MATGLAQIGWTLRGVAQEARRPITATVRLGRWRGGLFGGGEQLLLWEALVTGAGKGASHPDDAERAVAAFQARRTSQRRGSPGPAFNLLVASAKWAGLRIQDDELHDASPIYSAG